MSTTGRSHPTTGVDRGASERSDRARSGTEAGGGTEEWCPVCQRAVRHETVRYLGMTIVSCPGMPPGFVFSPVGWTPPRPATPPPASASSPAAERPGRAEEREIRIDPRLDGRITDERAESVRPIRSGRELALLSALSAPRWVQGRYLVDRARGTFPGDLDRMPSGHTRHCEARMKWGDGECECGRKLEQHRGLLRSSADAQALGGAELRAALAPPFGSEETIAHSTLPVAPQPPENAGVCFPGCDTNVAVGRARQEIEEAFADEPLLFADGLDAAIVGVAQGCGTPARVVYDRDRCIEVLAAQGDGDPFNVAGAYVGERTPLYLTRFPREEG